MFNLYVEENFKNLSYEEMNNKLLKLNQENRIKLMEFMQKYTESHNKTEMDDIPKETEENINNDFNKNEVNINNTNTNIYNNNPIISNMYLNNPMQINISQNNRNLINQIYMNPLNKINSNSIQQKNTNMNISMNINNNINNGSILYYSQPMNIYGAYNQNIYKK